MRLLDAPIAERVIVIRVATGRPDRASRLASMGVVSGVEVVVRQRRPALIFEYEETVLAIDAELAGDIEVELL